MSSDVKFRLSVEGDQEIQRKFKDVEQAIEDTEKAADKAESSFKDLGDNIGDLGDKADEATKPLEDTGKALEDVTKSASDVASDLKDADDAFGDIANSADSSATSLDAVGTSFGEVATSAVEADQNIKDAAQAIEDVETATGNAESGLDAVGTAFDSVGTSAQEAQSNIDAAAQGLEGIGTSTEQASTALDGLGSAFDGAGTSSTTFNDVLSSTGTAAQTAEGGITPLNTVLGQVGGTTQQASSGFQGFNSNLGIMTGFIGTASSAGIQLVTSLNNLHGAQIKVDAASVKLSGAIEAEGKARQKLNDLLESGSATTDQIAQAELDLQQAHDKVAVAAGRLDKSQTDLNIKMAKFGTDVLPNIIQAATSTVAAVSQMKQAFEGMNFTALAAGAGGFAAALASVSEAYQLIQSAPSASGFFKSDDLKARIAEMEKFREAIKGSLAELVQGPKLDADIKQLKNLQSAYETLGIPIPKVSELTQNFGEKANQATGGTQTLTNSTGLLKDEMGLLPEEALQAAIAIAENAEAQKQLETATTGTVGPLREQKAATEEIKAAIEGARSGIDSYVEGVQGQIEASTNLSTEMQTQNTAMEENIRQTMALVGSQENAKSATLGLQQSYADHQVAIDKLNTTLGTAEGQFLSYQNAVAAGNEQFLQWVQTTRDAAVQAETFKTNLVNLANEFGGLPGFMEGTVEEYEAFITANTEGGEAVDAFADMALESWQSLVSGAKPLFEDLKQAWADVRANIFEPIEDEEGNLQGFIDPIIAAFEKLPPAVAATLSEVEREALSFQGKFAATAEEAGTAWATNLQANMSSGFETAIAAANQAAADVLAPFIAEHPESAAMFQPLFDKMNEMGPGSAQAVQEILTELSGMPGPVGETAGQMLQQYQEKFGDQLPGVTKTGVEGAIQAMQESLTAGLQQVTLDLGNVMQSGFQGVIAAINGMINNDIKQTNVPEITANTNPANEAIQLIGTSLDQLKTYLESNPVSITVSTEAASAALTQLNSQIDAMAGKNVAITVDIGPAGIAITQLQAQLDAVHGSNVIITVDIGPAGIAITQLQGQIDGVHGAEVAITVDTGPAGIAIREIQGQIDNVHGTNVYITVDTSGAQAAIQQLQQQINSLQQSMGGIGTGFTPGYQSPYGSYQGAYGAPGFAKGFGPAVINRPTRMLVGEAGPEMVSVIPMKGKNQWQGSGWVTAATGMGAGYRLPGYEQYGDDAAYERAVLGYRDTTQKERDQYIASQRGSQQGTQQGMQQGMGGMQQAVAQGAQQGVQQGMQQGGGGGGYPTANYGMGPGGMPAGWGTGVQAWYGPARGGLGHPGMPRSGTWTGGAMGTQLSFGGGGGSSGGGMMPWPPTGGGGLVSSQAQIDAYNDLLKRDADKRAAQAGKAGAAAGKAAASSFVKAYDAGMPGQSQLINGVAATILGGNSNGASQAGMMAGTAAGRSFASSFNGQVGQAGGLPPSNMFNAPKAPTGPINIGQPGYPKVYTGQVPASYGKPLGQLINGIAATILPGQGPIRQAATGMHERLRKDTMIQAHKNERVDIGPGNDHPGKSSGLDNAAMGRITQLLERLLSQGSNFKVDFNVDGRKLSSVAAKNMGTAGYGDR